MGIKHYDFLLEEYLNKGIFKRCNQATKNPHFQEDFKTYKEKRKNLKKKTVHFENILDKTVTSQCIRISYLEFFKSSYYGVSLKEANLLVL